MAASAFGCEHYVRSCLLKAPCCGKFYVCRLCHDAEEQHNLDRFQVQVVKCSVCKKVQKAQQTCEECGIKFGEYYCDVCHLFDKDKKQYHCEQCGICRIGPREKYFHCQKCNLCLASDLQGNHKGLAVESDESSDSSKEPEAASNESTDSTDSIDSSITEEDNDTEEADDSNESDSTEATTAEIVTPEPPTELTIPPIIDTGRGDSLGYYEDSYKSMKFLKSNKIEPTLHKIYVSKVEESLNLVSKNLAGKKQVKSPSNSKDENAIDKDLKVFKAVQTSDDLDEDTSTPEVESQGLDSANAEAPQVRQAVIPQSSDQSTDSTASQGDESAEGTDSTSDETDSSQQSSEESTASPADDSNSDQTSESSESASVEATTNADNNPVLVK